MGVGYNPSIATGGLISYLDAGNVKSYPGSGTTWNDLSNNQNSASLTNTTYNSENIGSMVFNGTSSYCLLPVNFFPFPSLTTFTINLWFKSNQSTGGTMFAQQGTNTPASTASGFVPVIYLRSDGYVRLEPFWTNNSSNFILSSFTLNDNIWHNIVATFNSNTAQLYVDGLFNSQLSGLSLTSFTTNYYYFIGTGASGGSRGLGGTYFSGNISNFSFYDRALSVLEIQKNFITTRGRYGI